MGKTNTITIKNPDGFNAEWEGGLPQRIIQGAALDGPSRMAREPQLGPVTSGRNSKAVRAGFCGRKKGGEA